ncbi:MAG: MFS transporter [Hyphomicrobiales bacterium]|nr:MFS transporter [Hyphomicrobiales bacterium]
MTAGEKQVIFASSLGTVFEWYDFYLYGALTGIIADQFFDVFPRSTREIFALLAFAAGFVVRPAGALVFGRIGDLVGRKYTFLLAILFMGLSTFLVGLLPGSRTIGMTAPVLLVVLRLLQGLAMGGEYGGAATYVAEHAPNGRRGFYTSWLQTTATLGLLLSLVVILFFRSLLGEKDFAEYGWRFPFLGSFVLLTISLWIRIRLNESPAFQRMKARGAGSKAPVTEAFGRWSNFRIALLALFGLVAGQAVVWYASQFYALFFLQTILGVDGYTSSLLVAWALLLGAIFFVFFGWLSDRIGRKPVILAGCLIAALAFLPVFKQISAFANPALDRAVETVKVSVVANPEECGSLFNPLGTRVFKTSCDMARDLLARSGVRYTSQDSSAAKAAIVRINGRDFTFDAARPAATGDAVLAALQAAGYPRADDPGIVRMRGVFDIFRVQTGGIVALLFVLMLFVTMVYGPLAAALVELFPTRIRYTSVSLPYHLGNGWFGGLLPAISFAMVAQTGDIYYGLWYPIVVAVMTFIIGMVFIPETKDRDITLDDGTPAAAE